MTTPVKFELAKLLKEKGFHKRIRSMYCEEKLYEDTNTKGNYNALNWVRSWRNSPDDDVVSAPTIAEAVMWLYEKHEIWISVNREPESGVFFFSVDKDKGDFFYDKGDDFNSPTESYEAAIEYCLTNLI